MSKEFEFKLDTEGVRKNILQASWMLDYVKNEAQKQAGSDQHVNAIMGLRGCRAFAYIHDNTEKYQ